VGEMGDGRRKWEKKWKKKKVWWSYEREMRNKIDERVGEWVLLIKIDEYFHLPKLFG